MDERDGPFEDVALKANELVKAGATVFFKFTCIHCGSRQTFDVPNSLYEEGECEECKGITNLREHGCGFLMVVTAE